MNVRQLLNWTLKTTKGMQAPILLNCFVGILRVCSGLFFVWVCKQLIDVATYVSDGNIIHYALLLIFTVSIELAFSTWSNRIEYRNEVKLKNTLKYNLFSHIMLGIWDGKERFHSGDIINRLEEDVRLVAEMLSKTIPSIIIVSFQLITAFIFLAKLDIRMAYIVVLVKPLFLLLSKLYMMRMHRLTNEIRNTESRVQSLIQENIQHKILIQTLEQNKTVTKNLGFLQNVLYGQTLKRINFTLFSRTLVMAGFATGYVAAFLWGVNGIYQGLISFGIMTAFLQLVGQVQRPMVDLSRYIPSLFQIITSIERLKELHEIDLEEEGESQVLDGDVGICLREVSFTYPDADKPVIKDFSFDFAPRSKTAIVGETGVGKSTLTRIMLALLHPKKGEVFIYNDKEKINVSPLTRNNMVYVPQGNTLLSGTIRENLLLGNPKASDEELDKVLKIAVAEFVYSFPLGLDTICGERGTGLSEGQAQRICIARGLLRPGNILLLDELSSSLDGTTERVLLERLITEATNKTIIFITHRDVVTEYCKNIIILK